MPLVMFEPAMPLVMFEPTTPQSCVNYPTTELPRSSNCKYAEKIPNTIPNVINLEWKLVMKSATLPI